MVFRSVMINNNNTEVFKMANYWNYCKTHMWFLPQRTEKKEGKNVPENDNLLFFQIKWVTSSWLWSEIEKNTDVLYKASVIIQSLERIWLATECTFSWKKHILFLSKFFYLQIRKKYYEILKSHHSRTLLYRNVWSPKIFLI